MLRRKYVRFVLCSKQTFSLWLNITFVIGGRKAFRPRMIYLNCNMSMSAVLLGGSDRPESIAQMEKGTLYQSDRWMDRQPWQPLPLPAALSLSHAWMGLTLAEEAQGNDSSIPPTLAKFASVRAATGPAERKGERGAVPSPPIQRCIADCANLVHKSFSFHLSTCDRCNFLLSSLLHLSPRLTVLNKAR